MKNLILETYQSILNEYFFPSHIFVGDYSGWRIYYNKNDSIDKNGIKHKSHVHRRMAEKDRGNNFCSMDEFYKKLTKFIDELDNPNNNNFESVKKINKDLDKNNTTYALFRFKDNTSRVEVPVHIIIGDVILDKKHPEKITHIKDILITSIYKGIPLDRISYSGSIQLKEQYKILNGDINCWSDYPTVCL